MLYADGPTIFLSTLSLRRATRLCAPRRTCRDDFYPRSPCGERQSIRTLRTVSVRNFYPRSPCGERPVAAHVGRRKLKFLSTLSLRRATSEVSESEPLAEDFYPRSPCGERLLLAISIFIHAYFYPRSPCGERRGNFCLSCTLISISIHALLAESDPRAGTDCARPRLISIHALLAESDTRRCNSGQDDRNFYPRSPCGERHSLNLPSRPIERFLSTLSLRRATGRQGAVPAYFHISIHALLAESDRFRFINNPQIDISIHALLAESDRVEF